MMISAWLRINPMLSSAQEDLKQAMILKEKFEMRVKEYFKSLDLARSHQKQVPDMQPAKAGEQLDHAAVALQKHLGFMIIPFLAGDRNIRSHIELIRRSVQHNMERKQKEFGRPIFLISDEPYRELVYGNVKVPYLTKYYDNTIVCYSFSKSLSLPGDRIGYILVPDEVTHSGEIYKAVCGAGRALGYVCAPSLFQFLIPACLGHTGDISAYQHNRDLLMNAFAEDGFQVAKPDGAFYLFLKSPIADAKAFCEKAKEFELLLVPSDSFGFPGYVRVSYCVATDMIERSLPAFKKLAESYGLV